MDISLTKVVDQLKHLESVKPQSSEAAHKAMDDLKDISSKIKEAIEESSEAPLSEDDAKMMKKMAKTVENLEARFRAESSTSRAIKRMNELLGKDVTPEL